MAISATILILFFVSLYYHCSVNGVALNGATGFVYVLSFQYWHWKGDYDFDADVGQTVFNTLFHNSQHHILLRYCTTCGTEHKYIFYRRVTDKDSVNLYYLAHNWMTEDTEGHMNNLHTNFDLYSTLDDALNGSNSWSYCNYDDLGIGMFRNCGVNGSVSGQWTSATQTADMALFYIYAPEISVREYKATSTSFGGQTEYDFTHLTKACASLAGDWVPARIETALQNAAAWAACLETYPTVCFLDIVRDNVADSNWYYLADGAYDSSNPIDFLYWDEGEPGTEEACVTMNNGDHWHDMSCVYSYPVLCMLSSELYPSDTLQPTQVITVDPTAGSNDEDSIDTTAAPYDGTTIDPTTGLNDEEKIDSWNSNIYTILFIVAACIVLILGVIAVVWCLCAICHAKHESVLKIENHIDNNDKGEISEELSVSDKIEEDEGVRNDNAVNKNYDNVVAKGAGSEDDHNHIQDTAIVNGEFIAQNDAYADKDRITQ